RDQLLVGRREVRIGAATAVRRQKKILELHPFDAVARRCDLDKMQAKCHAKDLEREGGDQVALADIYERQAPNDAASIRPAEKDPPAERSRIDLGYVAHQRG